MKKPVRAFLRLPVLLPLSGLLLLVARPLHTPCFMSPRLARLSERGRLRRSAYLPLLLSSGYFTTAFDWYLWRRKRRGFLSA